MVGLPVGGRWQQTGRTADLEKELSPAGMVFIVLPGACGENEVKVEQDASQSLRRGIGPAGVTLVHGTVRTLRGGCAGGWEGESGDTGLPRGCDALCKAPGKLPG